MMVLIFDIDDTLIDHSSAVEMAARRFYLDFINSGDIETFLSIWEQVTDEVFEQITNNDLSFAEAKTERMRKVLRSYLTDPELSDQSLMQKLSDKALSYYESSWRLFPDVKIALRNLRKKELFVLSNGLKTQQTKKLEHTKILSYFKNVITSEEIGAKKPDIRFFQRFISMMHLNPTECSYVGNDLEKDVLPALSSGMNAVLINRSSNERIVKKEGYLEIASLVELIRVG